MTTAAGTTRSAAAVAGAILAGGRASRFGGRPKGLELIAGVRIVDRVAAALGEVTVEQILVGATTDVAAAVPQCALVADEFAGAGPLGAIVTALRATGRDTLVVAWDMPFVTAATLRPLLADTSDADVVLWARGGEPEPLCALYRRSSLVPLSRVFSDGERSPRAALRRVRARLLEDASPGTSPFTSINSAEQLDAARHADATPIA